VAIAPTGFISTEDAHAKRPSRCSQHRQPTQLYPPRRHHNCSSLATSLLTIDLDIVRTLSASHSRVTNRPRSSVPCTFEPQTSLFFVFCSLYRFLHVSAGSSRFGKMLICTLFIYFQRTTVVRCMGKRIPLSSSQQDSGDKSSSVPR
jgi:hypothetical protein